MHKRTLIASGRRCSREIYWEILPTSKIEVPKPTSTESGIIYAEWAEVSGECSLPSQVGGLRERR